MMLNISAGPIIIGFACLLLLVVNKKIIKEIKTTWLRYGLYFLLYGGAINGIIWVLAELCIATAHGDGAVACSIFLMPFLLIPSFIKSDWTQEFNQIRGFGFLFYFLINLISMAFYFIFGCIIRVIISQFKDKNKE